MDDERLVREFLYVSKVEKNLSERTIKAYKCDLMSFHSFLKSKHIDVVRISDLREYLGRLARDGLKDSSIRRRLATIKVFFSFLEGEGIIKNSPARKLTGRFKVAKRLPKIMSSNEVRNLLLAAYRTAKKVANEPEFRTKRLKVLRDRAMLEILFATGIRIDELVKLNIHDIDVHRRTLNIFGKGRIERLLYISCDEVLLSIREYLNYRSELAPDTDACFINKFKRRLSVHSLGNIFNEYSQMAGIKRRFTPHCLRHTMATMLLENGADVRSVQEILGHSRISTTEIYLEVSKHRKQEVLSRFNQRNHFCLNSFFLQSNYG